MISIKHKQKIYSVIIIIFIYNIFISEILSESKSFLNSKLQKTIEKKKDSLKEYLNSKTVYSELVKSNFKYKEKPGIELLLIDSKWSKSDKIDDFKKEYLVNPCSSYLLDFQERNDSFIEIIITNKYGLNVCQTNLTTDIYQKDKSWWQDTSSLKKSFYHNRIELDESVGILTISLYIPITNKEKLIGVAKAVLDITSFNLI